MFLSKTSSTYQIKKNINCKIILTIYLSIITITMYRLSPINYVPDGTTYSVHPQTMDYI